MKILALMILGLMVVGCGKANQTANEKPKATPSNNSTAKPVKELTLKEKVVGFYEGKSNQDTNRLRLVLWENGEVESYRNGKKRFIANWKINKNGELNVEVKEKSEEVLFAFRINPDGSLTGTTATMNGKQKVLSRKDQITLAKINPDAKGSPPSVKNMLAVIGEPLTKDEEDFVGRRKGECIWEDDDSGYHSEVIYRRDHTYSISCLYFDNPNVGEEVDMPREAEVEVVSGAEGEVIHGIWRIIGDHLYFLDLVVDNNKNPETEQEVTLAMLITSDKKSYVYKVPELKSAEGEIFPGWKSKEESIEKFKHPGMWAYNSSNALESFDLLTAYKYANEPEKDR